MLNREARAQELMRRGLERGLALQRLGQAARRLGHAPGGWLAGDDEYASLCGRCGRCGARIYARLGARVVEDGEALTERAH